MGRIAIPISGGLDSRTTVAAITRERGPNAARIKPDLWAYSYGYTDDSQETRIAERIAAARNLPFGRLTISPYLLDYLSVVQAAVEGFQDVTQARQAAAVETISLHADYLIAAHWGDVWLDDSGFLRHRDGNAVDFALKKITKGGRAWLLEQICQKHLENSHEALLRKLVEEEMNRIDTIEDADFRIKAFKTDQWSFRWTTASLRMFQAGVFPRLPFYDTRLTDFFCSVPTEAVEQRRLQIDYIKRFARDLARITWQAFDTNLFLYRYFDSLLLPKRALKKVWRTITRKHVVERNWEVQFLNEKGKAELSKRLLKPGLPLHEFVSPKVVQQLLDDFYRDPFAKKRGYTISQLTTFSAWLDEFY